MKECFTALQTLENAPVKAPTPTASKKEEKKKDTKKESKPNSRTGKREEEKPFIDLFAAKRAKYSEEVFLLFGHLGLLCATNGILLDDVATPCAETAAMAQTLQPRILSEYIKSQVQLINKDKSENRLKLNKKMLTQRTKAIRVLERAIDSAKRLYDEREHDQHELDAVGNIIGDGCILLWNMCLPLLQTNLRKHVSKSLQMASAMLAYIDSNLNELRIALHFELALCHKYEDMLTKSFAQCTKAINLDYVANEEEKLKYAASRPLDRFLLPLHERLELKVSSTKLPTCHEDEAFLLIEQARDSQDPALRTTMLERAMALLNLRHNTEDPDEVAVLDNTAALIKKRQDLWSEVVKTAWQGAKIVDVVRRAANSLFKEFNKEEADIVRDREGFINLATANFAVAESYIVDLREQDGLDLDQSSFTDQGQITTNPAAIDAQANILWNIEEGIRTGIKCKQNWIVVNGCIYLWNYFLVIFRDQEKYAPYVNNLRSCHESLVQIISDSTKEEDDSIVDMDTDVILLRITHAYVCSLIQRFVLMRNRVISNPVVPITGEQAADVTALSTSITELEEKGVNFPQLLEQGVVALLQNIGTAQPSIPLEKKAEKKTDTKKKDEKASTPQPVAITDDKSLLEHAIAACERVVTIFTNALSPSAAPTTSTKNDKKSTVPVVKGVKKDDQESEGTTTPRGENPATAAIFKARAILYLRVVVYRLQQALAGGKSAAAISTITSEDMEKICTNIEVLNGTTVLSADERVKILNETQDAFLKSCLSVSTLEAGAKLALHGFQLAQYKLVIALAEKCAQIVQANTSQMTAKKWRWMTLINVYCGRSISCLLSPTNQNQRTQVTLRQRSMEKYVAAMECASQAPPEEPLASLILYHFRQIVQPLMQTASTSVAKRYYYGEIIDSLDRLLQHYTNVRKNDADNQNNETPPLSLQDASVLEQIYSYYLTCLREFAQYGKGLDVIKRALVQLPISSHKSLWPVDIEFRSLLGQTLSESIMSRVSSYNAETQARVWAMLGHCSRDAQEKRSAFQRAISLLNDKPTLKVSYMCEYAIWLYSSGDKSTEATDILMEAVDMLNELDDVSMFVESTASGRKQPSARTSVRSSSTTNRKTFSVTSSKQSRKSGLSKKSKLTKRSKSTATSSAGEEQPSGDDLPGPLNIQQLEKICTCYVLLAMMTSSRRDSLDYCLTAQFYYSRMLLTSLQLTKALDRNFDLVQLLNPTSQPTQVEAPKTGRKSVVPSSTTRPSTPSKQTEKAPLSALKLPNSLEDWIGYEIPKEARQLWAKDSNEIPQLTKLQNALTEPTSEEDDANANWYEWIVLEYCKRHDVSDAVLFATMIHSRTINAKSVDEPCRTLYYLDFLIEKLKREGYHIHALPLLSLMKIISEDVVADEGDLSALANLKKSDLYAQLRIADKEKPQIAIKDHVKRLMTEEHEMMASLSNTGEKSASAALQPFNIITIDPVRTPVRRTWIDAAQIIIDGFTADGGSSAMAQVRSLVQLALADSKASGDWQCCAKCYSVMARMFYMQGKFERALHFSCKSRSQLLFEKAASTNDGYSNCANVLQFYRTGIVDSLRYLTYMTQSAEYGRDLQHWLNMVTDIISDSLEKFNALTSADHGEANFQLAMLHGDIAHVIVEMGSAKQAEIEKRIGKSVIDLFKLSVQGLTQIASQGLEYGRVLYRYASSLLQAVPVLGSDVSTIDRTTNQLKPALQAALDANACVQALITEAVPPITDHTVIRDDDHPVAHLYALTQILCGRIQLLIAQAEYEQQKISTKELQIANKVTNTFPVMEGKSEEETQKAMSLLMQLTNEPTQEKPQVEDLEKEDDALAMFAGALNITSSHWVRARVHVLMAQSLKLKHVKNRKIPTEQIAHHLDQCLAMCKEILAVGYDPGQCVSEIMATAYLEMVSLNVADGVGEIPACKLLSHAQNATTVTMLARIFESCSFAESVDTCMYRLLRQCNSRPSRIEKQKTIHQQLLSKSSSYSSIYEPVLTEDSAWPSIPDDVVVFMIQPSPTIRGSHGEYVLDSKQEILHCALISRPDAPPPVVTQPTSTSKKNDRVTTPSAPVTALVEEEPRQSCIYRSILFNYDQLHALYSTINDWNAEALSASNEKQSIIRDGRFIELIYEKSKEILAPIFTAYKDDLHRVVDTKKKFVFITSDEQFLELPLETCLDAFMNETKRFESITRDFSLGVFSNRLAKRKSPQTSTTAPTTSKTSVPTKGGTSTPDTITTSPVCTVDWSQLVYIVDPFCDQYKTISDMFEKELISPYSQVASTWLGIRYGVQTVPCVDEFQKLLNVQGNACFVYHGYNTFLEHIMDNASTIGNLDLSGFEMAIVTDRVVNNTKRKAVKETDGVQFERNSNLKSSSRTAALMTLRGITTVVSNLYISSNLTKNFGFTTSLLAEFLTLAPKTVESVTKTPAKKAPPKTATPSASVPIQTTVSQSASKVITNLRRNGLVDELNTSISNDQNVLPVVVFGIP